MHKYASYQQVRQYSNVNGKPNETEYTVENVDGVVNVRGTVNHRPIRYKGTLKKPMPKRIAQWMQSMMSHRIMDGFADRHMRKRSNGKVSKRKYKKGKP